MKSKLFVLGLLAIFLATLGYGIMPAMSILAMNHGATQGTILFSEFFIAAILMWGYVFIRKIPFIPKKNQILPLLFMILSYTFTFLFLYLSYDYISGSLACVISFIYPGLVVLFQLVSKREPFRATRILCVIISLLGIGCIGIIPGTEFNVIGIILALICAVFYACYALSLSIKALEPMDSFAISGYTLIGSSILYGARCLIASEPLITLAADQIPYILFLAIFCAFITVLLYTVSIKIIGPSIAALIATLEPAFACVFGYLLCGDDISIGMIIGCTLIVIAVILTCIPDKEPIEIAEDNPPQQE